jgi:glyoxylase-like metal-dependent hydrolase (beta-lactamase superfamily II)
LLHGDTQVTDEIKCVVTPGHTRGHQCILIEGDDKPVLYVADLASYAVHMERSAWMTAYDVEPLENLRTKRKWQEWALREKAHLIFEHDTTMKVGQLIKDKDERLKVQSVEF